ADRDNDAADAVVLDPAPEPLVRVGPDGEVRSVDPGYDELRDLLPQRQPSQRRLGPRLGSVGPGRLAGACRALRTPHEREEREEAEDGSRSREKGSRDHRESSHGIIPPPTPRAAPGARAGGRAGPHRE